MRHAKIIIAAAVLGGLSIALLMRLRSGTGHQPRKMNILYVSACSLRKDRLGIYDTKATHSPQIDAWAKSANFVFDNAVAERPWQAFMAEADDVINSELLLANGYQDFARSRTNHFMIPPMSKKSADEWFWTDDAVLHYSEALAELKDSLLQSHEKPFFAMVLLKYMHYPYVDPVNMGPRDWAKLEPKSQELLARYRSSPARFKDQLPLVSLLFNSYDLLKQVFGVRSEVLSTAGIVSDPARDLKWRQAESYAGDLKLVTDLYDLKMEKFDGLTADILNLYGNAGLQNNTVVVFSGDHGEAFMEHGVLGHSVNLYDEMLSYPLIVKFPGRAQPVHLAGQINHRQAALLMKRLIAGEFSTAEQFERAARASASDYVFSRNCADTMRSARYRGEWKLIKTIADGNNELYDLKKDPEELHNVAAGHPEMAFQLEEQLMANTAALKRSNTRAQRAKLCL